VATFPDASIADLQEAYANWPGGEDEKGSLLAMILRVRIERVAAKLPSTVIAVRPDISHVERRLYLSIGEPGLTSDAQLRRMRAIAAGVGAYHAICELLHGRNPDPTPPLQDLRVWAEAVDNLELEFGFVHSLTPVVHRLHVPTVTSRD
jgi:hypothetical protein